MRHAIKMQRSALLVSLVLFAAGFFLVYAAPSQAQSETNCRPRNLNTANWTTDFCQSQVDFAEIRVGHPVKDGIPAVNDPALESIADASTWLSERSPVIALEIDGQARAYPLAVLMWHEIANDEIAGQPIAVTFCPLCNSAITFDRRVDGAVLDFGVSGLLRNSDLIMYDRQSETWWQQLTGEALVGQYAGALLNIVPSQVISFGSFAQRYPEGAVMSRATGYNRQYGINPYRNYDSQPGRPFLFDGPIDPRLPSPVDHVLAALVDGAAKAYPFDILRQEKALNDVLGEKPIVIFFQSGVASALGDAVIDNAQDIGTAGMYEATLDGELLHFVLQADGSFQDENTGSTWNAYGEAIAGALAGRQLQWVNAFPHFWFAWAAFQPETAVYGLQ